MKSLIQFGTYGYLSALLAVQIAAAPQLFAEGVSAKGHRTKTVAKKSFRSGHQTVLKD